MGTIACLFPLLLFDILPQTAYGASPHISGDAASLFIRIDTGVTGRVLMREIASHLGVTVRGDAGQELVGRNQLEDVPLSVAVSRLLPHSSFSIRYRGDGTDPEVVIFSDPLPSAESSAAAVIPPPSMEATNRAGVVIPTANRAEFIRSLPISKMD